MKSEYWGRVSRESECPTCVTLSLCHSLTVSLSHCVTLSLCHSLTVSLSLRHSLAVSLCHYATASLCRALGARPEGEVSVGQGSLLCAAVSLSLCHCLTASPRSQCPSATVSLCHYVAVPPVPSQAREPGAARPRSARTSSSGRLLAVVAAP